MNTEVIKKVVPMTPEDKEITKKSMMQTLFFVPFFLATLFFMYRFSKNFTGDLPIFAYCVFGFMVLVALFILFTNVYSHFDTEKIVTIGYVTHKEHQISRSQGKASSRDYYYITIGGEKRNVLFNHYLLADEGDKIEIHESKKLKSIFKITILESARIKPESEITSEKKAFTNQLTEKEIPLSPQDKTFLNAQLTKYIFRRTVILGVIFLVLSWISILAFALMLELSGDTFKYVKYGIYAFFGLYWLYFNQLPYKIYLDLRNGVKKRFNTKIIRKYENLYTESHNNKVLSETRHLFIQLENGLSAEVKAEEYRELTENEPISICVSPKSKLLLHLNL
jgi:hypothetical protein